MSDDLADILDSICTTQANILDRLNQIEQAQELAGATELVVPGGLGYTSPTSPPSQRILVRQGYTWISDPIFFNTFYGKSWQVAQVMLPISAFSDAYYYRAVVPFYNTDWGDLYDGLSVWEAGTDFNTFEECAAHFSSELFNYNVTLHEWGSPLFPFCAIAVRNNGTIVGTNQYLPITLTDRQQSSFLERDLRPWFVIDRVA